MRRLAAVCLLLVVEKVVQVEGDEVVTLTLFYREDDPLRRLMLDETQAARLDRLWDELHFVSHDALTLVDAFTRECLAIEVDTSLPGERVCRVLDRVAHERGYPRVIVTDNGPEFAGKELDAWAYRRGVKLCF